MECPIRSIRSIPDSLRREIREETGLDIEPDALTGIYKNMPRGIIALVFSCKVTGGQFTTNNEVTAFRWADQDDNRQLTNEAYAIRLLDGLCEGALQAIREHDGTTAVDGVVKDCFGRIGRLAVQKQSDLC